MLAFDVAARAVAEALRTGQVGTPVAIRAVAHLAADHGKIERQLARILEHCVVWLGGEPDRLTALGGADSGQVSALARFESGASALASAGSSGTGRPLLELTVWGDRGILSWEPADSGPRSGGDIEDPGLSERSSRYLGWLRESLRAGQTLHIRDGSAAFNSAVRPGRPRGPSARERSVPEPGRKASPPFGVLLVAGDFTHQPNYAEAFQADPRCRLVGVADEADVTPRRRELNEQFARRLGLPHLPDLDEALRRDDVQIVSLCAEPERRGPIAVKAARAGKHLFLDKPLAGTLEEADAVVGAIQESGVVAQMWSLVHNGHAERLREVFRSGALGDPVAIHQDLCFAKGVAGTAELGRPRQETPSPLLYELPDSKRELTNVGVYPLTMLLWLTGRRVLRVSATTGNYFFREHQGNDMEDFGQMLLELDGGLVATVSAGRTGWRSHRGSGLSRACLIGGRDSAALDADRPRVSIWADVEPWTAPPRDPEDPMGMWATPRPEPFVARPKQDWTVPRALKDNDDIPRFLDLVEAGRASDVPAELGAEATEVLLAAYRSAASGEVVDLPLPRG